MERARLTAYGQEIYFDSFSPSTLLHLYLKRVGSLKHKDLEKVRAFAKSISRDGQFSFSKEHEPYRVFHDFANQVRTQYPTYSALVQTYNLLDEMVFNGLISHKIIPRWIWDLIINNK